jgi:hypothetical protein
LAEWKRSSPKAALRAKRFGWDTTSTALAWESTITVCGKQIKKGHDENNEDEIAWVKS